MTTRGQRGVTLLEVMIASAIAVIIALGLVMVEGARARVHEAVRRPLFLEPEHKNAALAALRMAKDLETTDRFEVIADGTNQLLNVRIPDCPTVPPNAACFTNWADFQWVQYKLTSNVLRMYRFTRAAARPLNCLTAQVLVLASQITGLTFPPTVPLLNNSTQYQLTWTGASTSHIFQGQVVLRLKPDQSGPGADIGLDVGGVSPPPGIVCP